jgi:hypothetical protein
MSVLYSTINLLARLSIEIHLVFMIRRILFPIVSNISKIVDVFLVNVQNNYARFTTNARGGSLEPNLIKFALPSLFNGPFNGSSKNWEHNCHGYILCH